MGFLWPKNDFIEILWDLMILNGVSMGFKRGSMRFHGGSIGLKEVSTGLSGIL